jgi:HK97 family phage major capsid protein
LSRNQSQKSRTWKSPTRKKPLPSKKPELSVWTEKTALTVVSEYFNDNAMATAKKISSIQTRSMPLEQGAIDEEKRTLEMSFSSEHPVERSFRDGSGTFQEILDHSPASVSLSRLNGQAALLLNHDPDRQIGVVERAWLDGNKLRATVRFSSGPLGEEIFRDVKDGIRNLVSIGYRLTDRSKVDIEERDGVEAYRFRAWEPYEGSIVSIPADPTVGVGRNQETPNSADFELPMKRNLLLDAAPPVDGGAAPAPAPAARTDSPELVRSRERERTTQILKLGSQFRTRVTDAIDLANAAIESGTDVAEFQRTLLDKLSAAPIPNGDSAPAKRDGAPATETATRTLGELITGSDEYKRLTKEYRNRMGESKWARTIDIPDANVRATLTTTVAGLTKYERPPGIVLAEQQPLQVAQLFASGTTEQTTIRYMREDTYTNAADTLAEEGTYAEASWDLSEQDAPIKKLGVIGRVTDEIFEDSAAIESYVNARLPFMVQEREELQLLNGAGTGSQQTGIFNVSGIQTLASASASSVINAIHKAKTKVQVVGRFAPDAILLNPYDWENIKLTQDANGQYLAGGPFYAPYGNGGYSNVMMLWGLPAISSTNITQGTALVGAFRLGGQVWRRKGITIETTNSDASDFANGRIAIRVTERIGLAVYRPLAFCSVTGIPA